MLARCLAVAAVAVLASAGPPSPIYRPCYLDDYKCISDHLAAISKCIPGRGQIPSQYEIPVFRFEIPYFNATYVDHNLITRNHDKCRVSEFYDNVRTLKTVLTVDCPWLNFESNRTLAQHMSFKEDVVLSFYINGSYPLIRLTTVFDKGNNFDLCSAFTFADLAGGLPIFHINPNDQRTAQWLSKDLTLLHIYEREHIFGKRNWLARSFISRTLCDFGCHH
ncbi:fibrohexamerin [Bombyx mandarina]|uniref:Fibrohexamerin n=2 Tax=cellular organisms TaxID=131567 RepID=A0A6J2KE10_BOMMA|nr:fibrohexamerin [Bombyx mandarina]